MDLDLAFKLWLLLFGFVNGILSSDVVRDVRVQNYNCPASICKTNYTIVHVKAVQRGSNDTIHYLWSTIGLPAIVVGHNYYPWTKLNVDWKSGSYENMKVEFIPEVLEISGLVFKDVTEYIDSKDDQNANMNIVGDIMRNFTWSFINSQDLNEGAVASFRGNLSTKSFLTFNLRAFAKVGYDTEMPQEPVNSNSVRFAFALQDLPTTSKQSRFSIGIAFMKQRGTGAPTFSTTKSIDDDRTPGIFKLLSFKLPTQDHANSFASWKPVAYNDESRDHSKQTFLHNFPKKAKGTLAKYSDKVGFSIANTVIDKAEAYVMKVSFGQQKDGFYRTKPYRVWTGLFGHGDAPQPSMSKRMYLTLFLGFGIPLAFAVLIVLAIFVKKLRLRKRASYKQIN